VGTVVAQVARTPAALPPLIGALLQIGLALFLVVKRGDMRLRFGFAGLALSSAAWAIGVAIGLSTPVPAIALGSSQVALIAIAVSGPCSLAFALALLRMSGRSVWIAAGASLAVAGAILALPRLTTIAARGGGFYPVWCPAVALATGAALPPLLVGLALVRRAWMRLAPCRRRRQLGWALAAMSCGLSAALDLRTVFSDAYPIAWLTGTVSCLVLYYAIAAHRLMAIATVARQALVGLLGAVLAAVGAYGLVRLAGPHGLRSPLFVGGAAAVLFVVVRVWTSSLLPPLTRVIGVRRRAIDRAWAEFERRALDAHTTDDVQRLFGQALHDGLDVELRVLYADPRFGGEEVLPPEIARTLAHHSDPILHDLLELDSSAGRARAQALDALGADALVPLARDQLSIGVAALVGPSLRRADDELADDLARVGALAARAWMNARLYEEVARRQAGLEAEVRERTAALEQALAELKSAQVKLVEAERSSSLGLLVAGISHEINNALNFISANLPTLGRYAAAYEALLDRAERAGAPPRGLDATHVAQARAELPRAIAGVERYLRRISAVVADLRKFARPDTERRLVRVDEGLDAVLNLLRRQLGRLDVVRLTVGQPQVDGYPGPLNQCFFNLLLNAVEAAREEVAITLRTTDDGAVELVIADDGAGLPPELLDRPLQPFFTTKPARAGLGLTVSRGIVERHGGTLALGRGQGGGARVCVRLPAQAPLPVRAA
jgi:signal transduction histidine kinase